MRRSVESPDLTSTALRPDDRPADADAHGPGDSRASGMASCDNLNADPEHQAVEVADATGVGLVAEPPTPPQRRWASLLGLTAGVVVLGGMSAAFLFFVDPEFDDPEYGELDNPLH